MTQSLGNMTVMEFDAWVAGADDDRAFELVDGVPLPVEDAGEAHEQIASNLGANLKQAMDKRGYRTYQEGIMVQASASPAERNKFRPDVVVRCGSLSDNTFISDPIVVIEVVSPPTVDLDLGRKLQFYGSFPLYGMLCLHTKTGSRSNIIDGPKPIGSVRCSRNKEACLC